MKHPKISQIASGKKVNFMLYGNPGCGKTTMAANAKAKTLIVHPPTDHLDSIINSGADEWEIERWVEMDEVEEFARHNPAEYEWIWLDSISLFQDHGLEDIMNDVIAVKPHRAKGPIDRGEYGQNMERIKKWVRHMVGIKGFNLGITAHPAEREDSLGNVKLRPWIQGKNMPETICGYMNIVGYMEVVKDSRRVLRLAETSDYTAKDQVLHLPKDRLVDPTMDKVIAALPKRKNTTTSRSVRTRRTVRSA